MEMKTPEYPITTHEWDAERQNDLNFLAQLFVEVYLSYRKFGELTQEDYELVKIKIHEQEDRIRGL